ncbi:MAG: bifunctional glutamate N-acetyltransferase/amino-acid acetyltransferase ArgJ [Acidobacteria bacterium]|nr:MAG: bifunctional glutamate N-acetyltransferase/amino-acid acetyltransferase ArgJ [Acidobacteriota bacterium]
MNTASLNALPRGFRFAATNCGLRKAPNLDLGLIVSDEEVTAAGVFTQNLAQAAPVVLCRQHLRNAASRIRAIIVNSRNANCATGEAGVAAAETTSQALAREIGCDAEQIFVCSTGVIGLPLPVERILNAVPALVKAADRTVEGFSGFTRAIMTTDTRPKWAASRCTLSGRTIRLLGCAKGAGMIHPNMATMLAYIVSDAAIAPRLLQRALNLTVRGTFNSITVDGDTSTNDTLLALASGAAANRTITRPDADYRRFLTALENVCRSLALQIVADGEGATRVIEIEVCGAASDDAARQVASTIAGSSLVKTMFAGADPNWGRILAAAGRSGVKIDPRRANIYLGGILTCRGGVEHAFSEREVHRRMLRDFVPVRVELGPGRGRACMWTCDFTADYVHINASYRT